MALLREISNAWRFFSKTPRSEKAILFYAEHKGDLPYFEGIIRELTQARGRTISYITSDAGDPVLAKDDPHVRTFYLKTLLPYLFIYINSDVCAMTVPDLDHLRLRRSLNPVHYIYVMHTLVSTFRTYRPNALDAYDAIFCAGPHHVEEIRRREEFAKLKPKVFIEQGYWRLEEVCRKFQEYKNTQRGPASPSQGGQKTILIAPSWGKDNVLELCGIELVRTLLGEEYKVIVRPHPETTRKSPELLKSFRDEFSGNQNFILEENIASVDSLLEADLLICDMSGVAVEYAFGTERPVLFIDTPLKVINPNYEELGLEPVELTLRPLLGPSIDPKDIKNIGGVIKQLFEQKDNYRQKLRDLRARYVFNFGNSSKIAADYILSKVDQK